MERIRNFIQLTENFGTAGQPKAKEFSIIAENGYRHVINIGMPDHPEAEKDEGTQVSSLGMNYIHIPVPFENPCPEHARLFCSLLKQIKHEKVFIHCIMNYRVSVFMYHYLSKVEGWSDSDAKSPMFEKWNIEPQWQKVMLWNQAEIGL